jgi:hypothetical protein
MLHAFVQLLCSAESARTRLHGWLCLYLWIAGLKQNVCVSLRIMLGTRLHRRRFTDGATMEDISSLTHALHDLALRTVSITSSGIPLAAALPMPPPAGPPAVSPDALPAFWHAAPLKPVALQNHKREMQQILQESLQMLEHADGAKQRSLMLQQNSALARILEIAMLAAESVHELHLNLVADEVTFRRSALTF